MFVTRWTRRFLALALLASILSSCASEKAQPWEDAASPAHPWGHFSGAPITKWNPDGRSMTLLNELRYVDPKGHVWVAPAGSVVDGASIPRSLWSFMGGPFEGRYRNASVLHDVAYDQHNRPWEDCDRMFYNAMRCSGVGVVEAKTMFYALYRFGRHWNFSVKRAQPVKVGRKMVARAEPEYPRAEVVTHDEFAAMRDWVRNAQPSVEQIEQRAAGESH